MMDWKETLKYLVKGDSETEPVGLKNFISDNNELLEQTARDLTFAVNDLGFAPARKIFSKYWVNMSSVIGLNDDVSGYYTSLKLDRETSSAFTYTFYTIVTENGILSKRNATSENSEGNTLGDDGIGKVNKNFIALSVENARSMENDENVEAFVNTVMDDFAASYASFLKSEKNIE